MKIISFLTPVLAVLFSCTDRSNTTESKKETEAVKKQSFIPLTSFIKGELYEIKKSGINPLKYTTINNHTDSIWLKLEDLDDAVKEFLRPEIDSVNLISLFTEKSFFDQSINAYTFTYDPIGTLPDTITLKRWDVYIDPPTGKIKRIYLVKNISKKKELQLTWLSNQWCKIVTLVTNEKGTSSIEKEEKITWDF